ncbi:glycosyltransferase family 1 protein [Reichenbachiella agarivorans]|uniref:Glycosyltransferase family 1 protein n=1 Tax=Reichenbachiella agarivorans TaxID=2979464 RepID=A0ABY6CKJ8_9BACT|nr:glycosyltransferase family 1 protein [Reichenbachiella agarivorans]UXP30919.1 glycosyltransferase family 1 protein [Reichenbachiella agarivorans]
MQNIRKKVVLFADVLEEDFDGVSVTLNKIIANFPKDRFDLLIVTPHPPKDVSSIDFKILICPYVGLPFQEGYRLGLPNRMKGLRAELDQFKPDVLHFTSPSLLGRYAIKYARRNSLPVMTIYHTHYPTYFKYYLGKVGDFLFGGLFNQGMAWYYKNADLTLVPTEPVRKDLEKLGIKRDTMAIWGRAIHANRFNPHFRKEDFFKGRIPEGNKTVLFVSRLIKEKNVSVLADMYELFERKNKKITMVITGDGPEKEWLEEKMPSALFTGKLRGEELSRTYASADLFFFPSDSETFGNVVLEAMASGTPVVAADAGGPSDIVINGETGYLSAPGSLRGFYKRILTILGDDYLRTRMGKKAFEYANTKTIDNLHAELWQHYERVIKGYQLRQQRKDEPIAEAAFSYKEL